MESLIFLPLIFGLMWLVLIRPRQRWEREHAAFVAALSVGDEVVTSSGIYGTVTSLDGDVVRLRIASGVEIRIARAAVGTRADDPTLHDPADDEPLPHRTPEGE